MLAALRLRPHTTSELSRLGVGRPNSRAAELRRRGLTVVCEHDSSKSGAARYVYRLLSEPAIPVAAPSLGRGAGSLSGPVELAPALPARSTRPIFPLSDANGTGPNYKGRGSVASLSGMVIGGLDIAPSTREECPASRSQCASGTNGGFEPVAPAVLQAEPGTALRQLSLTEAVA